MVKISEHVVDVVEISTREEVGRVIDILQEVVGVVVLNRGINDKQISTFNIFHIRSFLICTLNTAV